MVEFEAMAKYCETAGYKLRFPSAAIPRERPKGWLQWKGSDICMDIHCICGCHSHVDEEFCYHVKCPQCGQVYECDPHITLHAIDGQALEKLLDEEPIGSIPEPAVGDTDGL